MIDFRYHVVSIMAVFLALALGLFIGSTSLRGTAAANIQGQLKGVANENKSLSAQLHDANSSLGRAQAFDNALEPYAVAGRLAGQSVVVVSAPGVDSGIRNRVTSALTAAGATVNGDVRLQSALLDPQQDSFLKTLTSQLSIGNRPAPSGSGAERALRLLANVLGTRPQDSPVNPATAARILSAFSDGKLLSLSGDQPRPATLALLLAPSAPATPLSPAAKSEQTLLAELARDLDQSAVGAAVAGPSTAAVGGLLDVVRSDKVLRTRVSSVDTLELPSGIIATVFALAEEADGRTGSYGSAKGADSPLPTPSPSP